LADFQVAASAREYAFWLARKDTSHVHVLAVIDVKAFEIPVMGTPDGFMPSVVTPPLQESQTLLDDLTATAKEHLDQFARECVSRGLHCSTEIRTGIPGEVIAREAVAHDIVIMSRSGYARSSTSEKKVESIVSHVIRGSIRPVMVVGDTFPPEGEIRNILVAFDGSIHAGRALRIAAELCFRSGARCGLVTVAGSEDAGLETLIPAEAYLHHHKINLQKQVIVGTKASEVICDLVTETKADVLVMGAYGHSPIREVLFGSTTERVLNHCGSTVILQS
jgi:nucleotide-binding universal stress UspA family protein